MKRFGIESQYLDPVFRNKDVDRSTYTQQTSTSAQLFICREKVDKLVGTGAAAYIKWGAAQRHKTKKDGTPGGLWRETPSLQRVWYQTVAAPPPTRIVVLKAFDEYFAPFTFDTPVRVDQRFNQINPKAGGDEELLIGFLCSTWFVMLCETYGRTAMGQGALEMPTNTLRKLPVPDFRALEKTSVRDWKLATKALLKEQRRTAAESRKTQAQRTLDGAVLKALGFPTARIDELYTDVDRMTSIRKTLAAGRGKIKRERLNADVGEVAREVAAHLRPSLAGRRFPQDFLPSGTPSQPVQLGAAAITLKAELMLDQREVVITAGTHTVFSAMLSASIGELFIRAVESGQRAFDLPQDEAEAGAALLALDATVTAMTAKLNDLVVAAGQGAQAAIKDAVEQELTSL